MVDDSLHRSERGDYAEWYSIAIGDAAVGEKESPNLVNDAVANNLGSKRVTAALPCANGVILCSLHPMCILEGQAEV